MMDPRLDTNGSSSLWLAGTDYASTPDSVALSIVGDLDIRAKVALDDWTPSAAQMLVAKDDAGQRSFMLDVQPSGALELAWFQATVFKNRLSSAVLGAVDRTVKYVRATLDVDNGAGGNSTTFYTSEDGNAWVQLGTVQTVAGVTSIDDTTSALQIGGNFLGSNGLMGRVFWAEVRNGIDGPVVASPDFRRPSAPRYRDAQRNVWTIAGSTWAWT